MVPEKNGQVFSVLPTFRRRLCEMGAGSSSVAQCCDCEAGSHEFRILWSLRFVAPLLRVEMRVLPNLSKIAVHMSFCEGRGCCRLCSSWWLKRAVCRRERERTCAWIYTPEHTASRAQGNVQTLGDDTYQVLLDNTRDAGRRTVRPQLSLSGAHLFSIVQ